MFVLLFALVGAAAAQSTATLTRGQTALAGCLEDTDCVAFLQPFMSEALLETGLMFQHDPLASSALIGRGNGLITEVSFDSNALGPRSALIPLVPLVPRVGLGYQLGSFTFDNPYPQFGIGLSLVPQMKIRTATGSSWSADTSVAVPLGGRVAWLGAELGYTSSKVTGPLLVPPSQLVTVEAIAPFIDPEQIMPCGDKCSDTFRVRALAARVGLALDPLVGVTAFMRGGVTSVRHTLQVQWDQTRWRQRMLQPQLQLGLALRAGDKMQWTFSSVTAGRARGASINNSVLVTKLAASMSFRWGDKRYWDDGRDQRDTGPDIYQPQR